MQVPARDTIHVHLIYSQNTDRENTYIITSTQSWGKPLKYATYSLSTSDNIKVDRYSYPPDSLDGNTCFWNKKDFMPTHEFTVWLTEQ